MPEHTKTNWPDTIKHIGRNIKQMVRNTKIIEPARNRTRKYHVRNMARQCYNNRASKSKNMNKK